VSDRNIGDAFRISYSDPLPDLVGDTPTKGGDCVGSQLVGTPSIYDRENAKHAPGKTALTEYGQSWHLSDAGVSALGAA
jgi:hypothetical protein